MSKNKKPMDENSQKQWNDSRGISDDSDILAVSKIIDALAGKIETLQMTNFMCHSNLELKFNSRINFITGRNGSGKSAIMVALIVVLGGSATLTGRGSGVLDFIKKGESWAKVSITLINEGINSFKKELYGSRITICRNISRTAANSYLCKSETGSIISKKKEEVDNIVLAFNLQIKNPICILNQDVARSFLCATDNSLRFTMFMRATQLESLKTIYMKTLELLLMAQKQLQNKKKGIEEANQEISLLKEKLSIFASLEKHVHERTSLENEYVWALVVNEETKLTKLNERKNELFEKKKEFLRGETNFEQIIKEMETEIEKCRTKLEEVKSTRNEKNRAKSELQREVQHSDRQIEKARIQVKNLINKTERQLADINGVKEHLEQNDNIASQSQAEKQEANVKINSLREELSELKDNIASAQRDFNVAQETKVRHSRSIESIKSDLGELEQEKRRIEIMMNGTNAKGQNNLLKFGLFTQELLKAIEEAAKKNYFQHKPIGPCGRHVTLTGDPKWSRAVESVIGGLMTTYCCDNQKDFQILSRIMDKICGNKQPPIIISKFIRKRHDVESQKVSVPGRSSVLDVLTFDNDIVFNTFVDQARIETILLFETDHQAASVLTHIQNVPKNLRMGLTLQSDQYYPAPNYRTYYGDPKRPLKYFDGVNKAGENTKKLEEELREANRALMEKNEEMNTVREEFAGLCDSLKQCENKIRQMKQNERRIQLELNHLKDIEESRPVTITKVALEEELESIKKNYDETMEKTRQFKEILDTLTFKKEEKVLTLNSLAIEMEDVETEISTAEEKLEEIKFKHRQLLAKKKGANTQVGEINKKLQDAEDEIRRCQKVLEEKLKAAREVCPERVETERSPVEVQKLLEKCEKYLRTAEKMTGSREATISEYKTKLELYKNMKKMAALLESTIETLTRVTFTKEQRLNILQSHTANLVSFYFQATLQTRGYDGQLKIDFENKVLDIEVKPKDATIARKDSKTLSGGERSYSTVSFILAIWKVVQMPVYFLDEFDVFMDKVNRKVIMDLLLEHANVQTNKQFVFITPQDISNIQASDIVSVYRLPDPVSFGGDCYAQSFLMVLTIVLFLLAQN